MVREVFRDEGTFQQRTGRNKFLCRNLKQQQIEGTKVSLCLAWSKNTERWGEDRRGQRDPEFRRPCGPFLGYWMSGMRSH